MRDEEGEGVGGESKSMFDFNLSLSEIRRKMQMTADGKEDPLRTKWRQIFSALRVYMTCGSDELKKRHLHAKISVPYSTKLYNIPSSCCLNLPLLSAVRRNKARNNFIMQQSS